jgi:hypothetical protein
MWRFFASLLTKLAVAVGIYTIGRRDQAAAQTREALKASESKRRIDLENLRLSDDDARSKLRRYAAMRGDKPDSTD